MSSNGLFLEGCDLRAASIKRVAQSLKLVAFFLAVSACSPVSKSVLTKRFEAIETSLHDHTGFMLYDPDQKKEIFSYQAGQYFTPASNTKILTLYAGLTLLGDSLSALQYIEQGDSLIFRGSGDPSLLYREVNVPSLWYSFLSGQSKKLFYTENNFFTERYGPNWAWDDFPYSYSVERSAMPLYGNYFVVEQSKASLRTTPENFAYQVDIKDTVALATLTRDEATNKVIYHPDRTKKSHQWEVPFKTSATLTAQLLGDTLKKNVMVLTVPVDFSKAKKVKNTPADTLYKVMMQESDNFIAEQLLMHCAAVLSDTINPEVVIRYMQQNHLNDLPDPLVWVDGSGLSRFNLFTPRSIVKVWDKLYNTVPRERLLPLLAIGGKAGTIRNYYKSVPPYIYGKTGTLRNNHTLSGYIITKKGRTLIFSFMSNNFAAPVKEVRGYMEGILKDIYTHY